MYFEVTLGTQLRIYCESVRELSKALDKVSKMRKDWRAHTRIMPITKEHYLKSTEELDYEFNHPK